MLTPEEIAAAEKAAAEKAAAEKAEAERKAAEEAELKKVIDPRAHAAIKEDLFKAKEKLRAEAAEKAAMQAKLDEIEKAKLVEAQNFKKLWEDQEQKTAAEKKRSDILVASYVRDQKLRVLEQAAIKAGMRAEVLGDLRVIDTSAVKVDVNQSETAIDVTVHDAEEFIEALKQQRPWNFGTAKGPVIHDGGNGPGRTDGGLPDLLKLTPAELIKLEKEQPEVYKQALRFKLTGKAS